MSGRQDDPQACAALAMRFFAAVTRGDLEDVRDCYAADAGIWHNTDGMTQTPAENLRTLGFLHSRLEEIAYEEARLHAFEGGFVQQHVLTGKRRSDGARVSLAACIVCKVAAGRIVQLDEYMDSAQVQALGLTG